MAGHDCTFEDVLTEGGRRLARRCTLCLRIVALRACVHCAVLFELMHHLQRYDTEDCRRIARNERRRRLTKEDRAATSQIEVILGSASARRMPKSERA